MTTCQMGTEAGETVWFVHVPHTAGTSVTRWFHGSTPPPGTRSEPHAPLSELAEAGEIGRGIGWAFGMVRNPWDRMLTRFYCDAGNTHRERKTPGVPWDASHVDLFRQWFAKKAEHHLERYGAQAMLEDPMTGAVAAVSLYEDGELGIRSILGDLAPSAGMPRFNPIRHFDIDYRPFYDEQTDTLLRRLCAWEIERFEYRLG